MSGAGLGPEDFVERRPHFLSRGIGGGPGTKFSVAWDCMEHGHKK